VLRLLICVRAFVHVCCLRFVVVVVRSRFVYVLRFTFMRLLIPDLRFYVTLPFPFRWFRLRLLFPFTFIYYVYLRYRFTVCVCTLPALLVCRLYHVSFVIYLRLPTLFVVPFPVDWLVTVGWLTLRLVGCGPVPIYVILS